VTPPRSLRLAPWVWVGVLLVLVGAGFALAARYRIERGNQAVMLAAEWDAVEVDSAGQASVVDALQRLRTQGLNAVVLSEDNVAVLVAEGRLNWTPTGIQGEPSLVNRLAETLEVRFAQPVTYVRRGVDGLGVRLTRSVLRDLTLGLDPDIVQSVRDANLVVIGRFSNPAGATSRYVRARLRELMPGEVVLPVGEKVLGFREAVSATADGIREGDLFYASAEFAKIAGDAGLAEQLTDRLIRLHTVQSAEISRMSPGDLLARYGLAARERNIRILLVRPFSDAVTTDNPFPLAHSVGLVAKEVEGEGLTLARAHPFADPDVARPVFVLIGLGVAMVAAAVAPVILGDRGRVVGILAGLATLGASVSPGTRHFAAFAAAFTFPLLAYAFYLTGRSRPVPVVYALMSLISLTGGLAVAGMLTMLPYLVRVDQFAAVKLAHFGPIIVVAVWFVGREIDVRRLLASPILWGSALAALVLLVALSLMLMRTGNDAPGAVSGLELRLRGILDALLYTRPRTKEFLMGHPALWVGLAWTASLRQRGVGSPSPESAAAAGVLALGAIGQTSIVNTLCHLHTPLVIGLARIGLGLLLGAGVGALGWMILQRIPGITGAESRGEAQLG